MDHRGIPEHLYRKVQTVLRQTFGLSSFRPHQEHIIFSALSGISQLAVLPTGAGKSLCYQLPSILLPQPTLVVSPLIALMKDQVDGLSSRGIPARTLSGRLDARTQEDILYEWLASLIRILYVAPERLKHPDFKEAMKKRPISLLVVDEAHCISEWGYDFRPDYRRIRQFREELGSPPIMALTATATARVKTDILHQLGLDQEPHQLVEGSINRLNIRLRVQIVHSAKDQTTEVVKAIQRATGGVILYADSRRMVEEWTHRLSRALDEPVHGYHAGMSHASRGDTQEAFSSGRLRVVVATNAFGMGIDRGDIQAVIHVGVPESIDAYYQEVGRAGRNGRPAEALMVIRHYELFQRERRLERDRPTEALVEPIVRRVLDTPENRWIGWEQTDDDVLIPVVLSILEEMGILEVGSRAARRIYFRRGGPHWPYLARAVAARMEEQFERRREQFLSMKAYVVGTDECRRRYLLTYYGQSDETPIEGELCCDLCQLQEAFEPNRQSASYPEWLLIEALKAWRKEEASKRGMPPYVILSDRDLMGIAQKRPPSREALACCRGIGAKKLDAYGERILAVVRPYIRDQEDGAKAVDLTSPRDRAILLFQSGVPFERVVERVERSRSTVRTYLEHWIGSESRDVWRFYVLRWFSEDDYGVIRRAFLEAGDKRLAPVYHALGGRYTFEQLGISRAVFRRLGTSSPLVEKTYGARPTIDKSQTPMLTEPPLANNDRVE